MTIETILNDYFNWMYDLVCDDRFSEHISYKKLLMHLHTIEFRYSMAKDQNRANDGINLRYRFALVYEEKYNMSPIAIADSIEGPCSVLEMMIALSIKCEENIMDDPKIGDRTSQWFWGMIVNMGLGAMDDSRFDRFNVNTHVQIFLDREYEPNGTGGLFTINNCECDLRTMEIWRQLCWYLDGIV